MQFGRDYGTKMVMAHNDGFLAILTNAISPARVGESTTDTCIRVNDSKFDQFFRINSNIRIFLNHLMKTRAFTEKSYTLIARRRNQFL